MTPEEGIGMSAYRITLLSADGAVAQEWHAHFESDDHAVDATGSLRHPYRILLHQGERLVGEFPPVEGFS